MKYSAMVPGIFLSRPNRFIAHVQIGGQEQICHVKNTGRCKELLVPGAAVWCEESSNPTRKTKKPLKLLEFQGFGGDYWTRTSDLLRVKQAL